MRLMGMESMAPKPDTIGPAAEHPVYLYLLRGLKICRVNQVLATDITYIPMAHGFACVFPANPITDSGAIRSTY
jgi:putative transposase